MAGGIVPKHLMTDADAVRLKMDKPIAGCEEWDNCIIWTGEDVPGFLDQAEPAPAEELVQA